ncbi:MAG: hypothetical protein AVDCRST_MAG49-506 [uncultured Thermomicrobiales bacterium]|uniref:Uncharacterized protein n=1 Tax=uncultured Thermomicrobiales bacterium TaxID=1645740 RepID=A0A6J4U199_9BACT|nr:MAG: hypothetical protein AVDCRST_MAG49-506 [uncultured Thermomicrobiales bacterium]
MATGRREDRDAPSHRVTFRDPPSGTRAIRLSVGVLRTTAGDD